jgi:hypothetical protein
MFNSFEKATGKSSWGTTLLRDGNTAAPEFLANIEDLKGQQMPWVKPYRLQNGSTLLAYEFFNPITKTNSLRYAISNDGKTFSKPKDILHLFCHPQ